MNKKIYITALLFFAFGSFFCGQLSAWDDGVTHKDISEYAAENSVLSKDKGNYLKILGFTNSLDEYIMWGGDNKKIRDWFRKGAEREDASSFGFPLWPGSTTRSFNHFHNPLKDWTQAGLNDIWTGESLVLWSQDTNKQQNIIEGDQTWQKTRGYFYQALISVTDTSRQENFAQTFIGLGHQMHLLQDTSVPDHVRNDAHPEDAIFGKDYRFGSYYFETWTKTKIKNLASLESFAPDLVVPNISFNISHYNLAPVTQLFDTDTYDGLNASAGINQGLSEYTNANFFSNDTIFAAERYSSDHKHYFPYPKKSSTDLQSYVTQNKLPEIVIAEDNVPDTSFWIKKERDGEAIAHFVRPSYLSSSLLETNGESVLYYRTFYQDDECNKDYAKALIPRAVGYSAGLLDYFFRGSIEISLPLSGIYSSTNDANAGFTRITLLAENKASTGDEMSSGTVELVVKYKASVEASEFYYKVIPEANGIISIPRAHAVDLIFDLSQDPLPVTATDVYLQLVYHGKLGNEDGAVAVGFKDISEPTPIDVFNNMDKICINHGMTTNWYDAGSQAAIQQVDENGDGIAYGTNEWDIYPHNLTLYVKFYNSIVEPVYASPSSYDYLIENIPAGTPMRAVYVLGDESLDYSYYPVRNATDSHDYWDHVDFLSMYHGDTARNQEGDYPVLYTFRNFRMWPGAGFIYVNAPYPDNSAQCPLSSL